MAARRLAGVLVALAFWLACNPATGPGGPGDKGGDQNPDAGPDAPGPNGEPAITALEARTVGRTGEDLLVTVGGADAEGDVLYVTISFFDRVGAPLAATDLDGNGTPDASGRALFAEPVSGETSFTGHLSFPGLIGREPNLASVRLYLEDAGGHLSPEVTAQVLEQAVLEFGQSCDPEGILNRCQAPFSCRSDPPSCLEGLPPEITQFAYLRDDNGPRMLFFGTDPDNDVASIFLEFLDDAGNPTTVDLDNDDTPESTSLDVDVRGNGADGEFFHAIQSAVGFDTLVPKLAATATDEQGHTGARVLASIANTPVRSAGQACDLRGFFDTCANNTVCVLTADGSRSTCQNVNTAITQACNEAPVLDPAGTTSTLLYLQGGSRFDPPSGCASQDPTGNPDGLARLHLEQGVPALTITTDRPGTQLDSILYVYAGCGVPTSEALGCNDDARSGVFASTVHLTNVPPGDYMIVVDSWTEGAGTADLAISLE